MKINKKTQIGIVVIVLLLVILYFNYNDYADKIPYLDQDPINYQDLEIQEPDYSISNKDINKDLLLGTWNSVYEIAGTNPEQITEINYLITFNQDNTFSSTTFGLLENGTYEISKNQIRLKDNQGYELQTYGEVSDNELKILIPMFPKKIVYERS